MDDKENMVEDVKDLHNEENHEEQMEAAEVSQDEELSGEEITEEAHTEVEEPHASVINHEEFTKEKMDNNTETKNPKKKGKGIKSKKMKAFIGELSTTNENKETSFYKRMTFAMVALTLLLVLGTFLNFITTCVSNIQEQERLASFERKEQIPNVEVHKVKREKYNEFVSLNANLKSLEGTVNVFSPVNGKLQENKVRLGDLVKKDDILGYVDASDIGMNYEIAPVFALKDGVVSACTAVPGETVSMQSVLYTIVPEGDMVLTSAISEKEIGSIRKGDKAEFFIVSNRNKPYKATLRYVSPVVNEQTRSVVVEFDVDKDQDLSDLKHGMLVSLKVESGVRENVIVVPESAVSTYLDQEVVYVVGKDNIAKRVPVEVGASNGDITLITKGLSVGDEVISAGSARDGQEVHIVKAN